jgi:hypothetical protein
MRTVSFFKGTAAVFEDGLGGGVGWLSLMVKKSVAGTMKPPNFKKV